MHSRPGLDSYFCAGFFQQHDEGHQPRGARRAGGRQRARWYVVCRRATAKTRALCSCSSRLLTRLLNGRGMVRPVRRRVHGQLRAGVREQWPDLQQRLRARRCGVPPRPHADGDRAGRVPRDRCVLGLLLNTHDWRAYSFVHSIVRALYFCSTSLRVRLRRVVRPHLRFGRCHLRQRVRARARPVHLVRPARGPARRCLRCRWYVFPSPAHPHAPTSPPRPHSRALISAPSFPPSFPHSRTLV